MKALLTLGLLCTLCTVSIPDARVPHAAPTPKPGPITWSAPEILFVGPDRNACGLIRPEPARPRPLVLWLHGGMGSPRRDKGLTAMQALKPFLKEGSYYLASPSAYEGEEWTTPAGLRHIEAVLDSLQKIFPVKMDSLIIVGVSDGSLGAFYYAAGGKHRPLRFLLFSVYPQLLLTEEDLVEVPAFQTTRWDVFQGGRDALFPADEVFPFLNNWRGTNPRVRLHLFPEGEHDFNWYGAHAPHQIKALFGSAAKK